jgi:hypothetical protein
MLSCHAAAMAVLRLGSSGMQGKLLIFRPYEEFPIIGEFANEPDIAEMRAIVGGEFAPVPGFLSIEHDGVIHPCVALQDADGKRKGLPLNRAATIMWDSALRRDMGVGLIRHDGSRADHLVGRVVVLFGD